MSFGYVSGVIDPASGCTVSHNYPSSLGVMYVLITITYVFVYHQTLAGVRSERV